MEVTKTGRRSRGFAAKMVAKESLRWAHKCHAICRWERVPRQHDASSKKTKYCKERSTLPPDGVTSQTKDGTIHVGEAYKGK